MLLLVTPIAGPDFGWACGWVSAATLTWTLNRRYTFRAAAPHSVREWGHWLLSQALGGAIGGISFHLLCHHHFTMNVSLALSTALGSGFNYFAGRAVVYGRR